MPEREVITLRAPKALVKKLDALMRRRRREHGARWSRNDEILAIVEDGIERAELELERPQ